MDTGEDYPDTLPLYDNMLQKVGEKKKKRGPGVCWRRAEWLCKLQTDEARVCWYMGITLRLITSCFASSRHSWCATRRRRRRRVTGLESGQSVTEWEGKNKKRRGQARLFPLSRTAPSFQRRSVSTRQNGERRRSVVRNWCGHRSPAVCAVCLLESFRRLTETGHTHAHRSLVWKIIRLHLQPTCKDIKQSTVLTRL